jgi:ATP-binding cassette subfamily F protein 3
VRWGSKVEIGYYAQQLEDLDERNEIVMELRRVAPSSATSGELRSFLARFLFFGDDVYKHVSDLSGGEKGRLALAKLIYSGVNVLVLDEPTNHLDIPSREALEEALEAYEGTIVTISHDRYFLDRVATQILALDGAGRVEHYNGDYTEYHDWKARRMSAGEEKGASGIESGPDVGRDDGGNGEAVRSDAKRVQAKGGKAKAAKKGKDTPESQRIKVVKKARSPEVIEAEISELEALMARLSEEMTSPEVARDITRLVKTNDEYQQTEARLAELMDEWERSETAGSSGR